MFSVAPFLNVFMAYYNNKDNNQMILTKFLN